MNPRGVLNLRFRLLKARLHLLVLGPDLRRHMAIGDALRPRPNHPAGGCAPDLRGSQGTAQFPPAVARACPRSIPAIYSLPSLPGVSFEPYGNSRTWGTDSGSVRNADTPRSSLWPWDCLWDTRGFRRRIRTAARPWIVVGRAFTYIGDVNPMRRQGQNVRNRLVARLISCFRQGIAFQLTA